MNRSDRPDSPPGRSCFRAVARCILLLGVLVATQSLADTFTWTGASAGGAQWSRPENWSPAGPPADGADLVFPPEAPLRNTINDLPPGRMFNSITFTGAVYSLAGQDPVIIVARIEGQAPSGFNQNSIGFPVVIAGGATAQLNAGGGLGLRLDGGIEIPANSTLNITGANDEIWLTGLSGAGALNKSGSVTLYVVGDNASAMNAIRIDEGTLIPKHANALGSSTTVVTGGASVLLTDHQSIGAALTINGIGGATVGAIATQTCYFPRCALTGPITLGSDATIKANRDDTLSFDGEVGETGGSYTLTLDATIPPIPGYNGPPPEHPTFAIVGNIVNTGGTVIKGGTTMVNGHVANVVTFGSSYGRLGGTGIVNGIGYASGATGQVAPGFAGYSPGALTSYGNVSFATLGTATYNVDIWGLRPGADYDQLNVTGDVDIDGANLTLYFKPSYLGTFNPPPGSTYDIITATGDIRGRFVQGTTVDGFEIIYSQHAVTLKRPGTTIAAFDVDLNQRSDALTDGVMIVRYLFGLTAAQVSEGLIGPGAMRDAGQIFARLNELAPYLDVDGDGRRDALTDGLLVIRYLFGIRGEPLIQDALGAGASRKTATEIESYIEMLR